MWSSGPHPRLGELPRGETIPWRVISVQHHTAVTPRLALTKLEPALTGRSTSSLLSNMIASYGDQSAPFIVGGTTEIQKEIRGLSADLGLRFARTYCFQSCAVGGPTSVHSAA